MTAPRPRPPATRLLRAAGIVAPAPIASVADGPRPPAIEVDAALAADIAALLLRAAPRNAAESAAFRDRRARWLHILEAAPMRLLSDRAEDLQQLIGSTTVDGNTAEREAHTERRAALGRRLSALLKAARS